MADHGAGGDRMTPGVAAAVLMVLASPAAAAPGAHVDGPSVACARVTSHVNPIICASADLSALDRALHNTFQTVVHQPTVNAAKLRADEANWVRRVLRTCADSACIKAAYEGRMDALRQVSQVAASPSASGETQSFPASTAVVAASQALIGASCDGIDNLAALDRTGRHPLGDFVSIPGQAPVLLRHAIVFVLGSGRGSEAFLFTRTGSSAGRCTITDFAVLPDHGSGLMSCSVDPSLTGGVGSSGVGVRLPKGGLAYWEVSETDGRLHRLPLEVLGWTKSVRCRQPEAGE